jgi:hypothetical protein
MSVEEIFRLDRGKNRHIQEWEEIASLKARQAEAKKRIGEVEGYVK